MKKTLLFITCALFAVVFAKAQNPLDANLGDFEEDTTIAWTLYGESYEIVDNPLIQDPNTSEKVLKNVTVNQYQGMSLQNLSYVIDSFTMFSFDVYSATGAVDIIVNVHGKTAEEADVTASYYPTTVEGAWLHYEISFDGEEYETHDTITQIDLQNNTAETELYWDNMLLTSKYEPEEPDDNPSAIFTATGNENKLMFFPNPASRNQLITIKGTVGNNQIELYNAIGQLKLSTSLNNGLLDVSSLSAGIYIVKVDNQVSKLVIK